MKENIEFIWAYARKYKARFSLMLLSILFTSLAGALFPFFLGRMINSLLYQRNFTGFLKNFCGYGIFFCVQQFMRFINTRLYAILEITFLYDVKEDILKNLFRKQADFWVNVDRGDTISRMEEDTHEILDYIYYNLFYTISDVFEFASQIILILMINWKLLILTLISMPISFVLPKICAKIAAKYYEKKLSVRGKFFGWIFDIVNCLSDLRLLSGEQKIERDFENKREKLNQSHKEVSKIEVLTNAGIEGTGVLLKILLYGVSAFLVIQKELLIGNFISVIEYFNSSLDLFNDMAGRTNPITENMAAVSRIREMLHTESDEMQEVCDLHIKDSDIFFDNISFAYEHDEEDIIKNISFKVKQGEHLVIAGKSGSGKTTLAHMLIGFYKPFTGDIYIGKHSITKENYNLRKKMGVVFQNTAVFDGSIRYNLIFDENEKRDKEIWKILEQLKLEEVIKSLPDGLSTSISNQYIPLSGGQIQRLEIARVVLQNPDIILFDEPTAAFDYQSELEFLKLCDTILEAKTIVIISHRLETLKVANKILFFHHGEIEGIGTHKELLESCILYRKYVHEESSYETAY